MKNTLTIFWFLVCSWSAAQDPADPKRYPPPGEPGPDRVYFRIAVYAFNTHDQILEDGAPYPEPILEEALDQASNLLGFQDFSFRTGTEWMVVSDGDMFRPLDYKNNYHIFSEHRRVRFTIIYDHQQRYLTLKDFIINDKHGYPVLRGSIGVADGGASVLGSMKKGDHGSVLMVVTFQTSGEPFPKQAVHATFTVNPLEP